MKKGLWLAFLVVAMVTVGCGGSSSSGGASLRAVNAIPGLTSANLTVGTTIVMEGGSYGGFTNYQNVTANNSQQFLLTDGAGTTLSEPNLTVSTGLSYTAYAVGTLTNPSILLLSEDHSTPANNDVRMNFVNLSPTIPSVDVYVTPSTVTSISGLTASASGVASQTSVPFTVAAGTYNIFFAKAGTQTLLLPSPGYFSTGALSVGQLPRYLLLDPAPGGASGETVASLND